jgi:apolipoprotein N-acyltransferase
MEARREVAVATTNSVSGFIDRDGRVVQRTAEFTADSMVVEMPLRSTLTPALRVAPWLERGLAGLALVAAVLGALRLRRVARPADATATLGRSKPHVEAEVS